MAKNKTEFKSMSLEELNAQLESARAQYIDTKFDNTVATLENTNVIREMRREIARILTELRSRELAVLAEGGSLNRDRIVARRARAKKQASIANRQRKAKAAKKK